MRIQVAGRQMDVGEALRSRIETELTDSLAKYVGRATDAVVTVSKDGIGVDVDCTVHLSSGMSLQAAGQAGEAHAAFGDALNKLEKRLRRYKRRLKNHHANNKSPLPAEAATAYVLAPLDAEEDEARPDEDEAAPLIIAEETVPVRTMSVAMAVMQLDLADSAALMFRNAANGGLNVVYRRPDGNVGWIDPARAGNGKPNGR